MITRTLEQIRLIGLEALSRELGPVGMIRFLQQFETGYGDYSVERHKWLDQLSVEELTKEIKQRRKPPNATGVGEGNDSESISSRLG